MGSLRALMCVVYIKRSFTGKSIELWNFFNRLCFEIVVFKGSASKALYIVFSLYGILNDL